MDRLAACSIELRSHRRRRGLLVLDKLKTVLPIVLLEPSDRAATEPAITIPKYQMGVRLHTVERYRRTTVSSSIPDFISRPDDILLLAARGAAQAPVISITQKPKDLSPIRPERRSHSHDHSGLHNDPCRRSDICSVRLLA